LAGWRCPKLMTVLSKESFGLPRCLKLLFSFVDIRFLGANSVGVRCALLAIFFHLPTEVRGFLICLLRTYAETQVTNTFWTTFVALAKCWCRLWCGENREIVKMGVTTAVLMQRLSAKLVFGAIKVGAGGTNVTIELLGEPSTISSSFDFKGFEAASRSKGRNSRSIPKSGCGVLSLQKGNSKQRPSRYLTIFPRFLIKRLTVPQRNGCKTHIHRPQLKIGLTAGAQRTQQPRDLWLTGLKLSASFLTIWRFVSRDNDNRQVLAVGRLRA